MNSLTNALKSEIARVARKELKDELLSLRKATTGHRSEIAALKREIKALQSQLRANTKVVRAVMPAPAEEAPASGRKARFSAQALAAQRAKLGLSQAPPPSNSSTSERPCAFTCWTKTKRYGCPGPVKSPWKATTTTAPTNTTPWPKV